MSTKIQKICTELCEKLNMEIVLYLPESYKKRIKYVCDTIVINNKNNRKARAYQYFLKNYSLYDLKKIGYDNIHCSIDSIKISLNGYNTGKPFKVLHELKLKNELAYIKSGIDRFIQGDQKKEEFYTKVTNILDQFAEFRKSLKNTLKMPYITNAFLKCWEMIQDYELIPSDHSSDYRVFCNAEFPGAFIFAIHHYMATATRNNKFEWFASSLWPGEKDILKDQFGLYRKYRNKWLMNSTDQLGDVTNLKTIDHIYDKIGESVDLYTSDIGIGLNAENFNDQEEIETSLNLGQIISGLVSLKNGGHLVCKMFMFFTPFNISLLSTLTNMFTEFYISKPLTSRPGNSEIYIIGKGYKGYNASKKKIEELKNFLVEFANAGSNMEKLREISSKMVDDVSEEFYLRIVNASYAVYQRQMRYVDMSVKIAEYLYKKHPSLNFNHIMNDRSIVPGTNIKLSDEINHRQDMIYQWKDDYKEYLLYKKLTHSL